MSLAPGTPLGGYRIVGLLGEGGMGQVYRAHDSKLGREVALKILPDAFALDSDRLARFRREAQLLASLNHPNIAAIYGVEDAGDTRALVLELVEGPTLADLIAGRATAEAESVDALRAFGKNARAVALLRPDVTDGELKTLNDAGVRGARFSLGNPGLGNPSSIDMIDPLTRRIEALGWHVQIYMRADQIVAYETILNRITTPMGR